MKYNRLNPIHWVLSFFSNSRKTDYLNQVPTYRVDDYDATRRIFYWFRNPAHDFCSHIIGFRGDDRYGRVRVELDNIRGADSMSKIDCRGNPQALDQLGCFAVALPCPEGQGR